MNDELPSSALDAQVDALLQRVARDREQRCSQMRAAAEAQAQEILRSGRAEARANVRRAVAKERTRIAQRLRQAEAGAELEARGRAQSETRRLLESMWKGIADALEARWSNPEHRRAWVAAASRQADQLLGASPSWRIEHGEGWLPEQRNEFEKFAATRTTHTIEWKSEPALKAGVKVRCEGVCLDATPSGLLANRADIESGFMAEYLAAADKEHLPHE
jgi:hypothetical protein